MTRNHNQAVKWHLTAIYWPHYNRPRFDHDRYFTGRSGDKLLQGELGNRIHCHVCVNNVQARLYQLHHFKIRAVFVAGQEFTAQAISLTWY